jgi:hypothetical protein
LNELREILAKQSAITDEINEKINKYNKKDEDTFQKIYLLINEI